MRASIRKPLLLSAPINPHNAVQRVEKNFHGKASDQRIFVTLHGMIFQSRETRTKVNALLPLSTLFTIYDLMDTLLDTKGIWLASFLAEQTQDSIASMKKKKQRCTNDARARACISALRVVVSDINRRCFETRNHISRRSNEAVTPFELSDSNA